ncbi:MAG: hypothetical protein ACT4OE_10210, partial [Sphingosinicella sp.]
RRFVLGPVLLLNVPVYLADWWFGGLAGVGWFGEIVAGIFMAALTAAWLTRHRRVNILALALAISLFPISAIEGVLPAIFAAG